ncbi:hypothetical protein B0H13DRAFT_1890591 [Mycena leptocephala]|nr:hypothetical protein B0H13DRAFT_1890591 [Mycena leptocephala]
MTLLEKVSKSIINLTNELNALVDPGSNSDPSPTRIQLQRLTPCSRCNVILWLKTILEAADIPRLTNADTLEAEDPGGGKGNTASFTDGPGRGAGFGAPAIWDSN